MYGTRNGGKNAETILSNITGSDVDGGDGT